MSLKAGWLALVVFVYVIGIFLGSTFENQNAAGTWAGSGTGGYATSPSSNLQAIMEGWETIQRNPVIGGISVVTNTKIWGAVANMLMWKFSFLYDNTGVMQYGMFYWIFLFPFAVMGMLCILLLAYGIITGNLSWG